MFTRKMFVPSHGFDCWPCLSRVVPCLDFFSVLFASWICGLGLLLGCIVIFICVDWSQINVLNIAFRVDLNDISKRHAIKNESWPKPTHPEVYMERQGQSVYHRECCLYFLFTEIKQKIYKISLLHIAKYPLRRKRISLIAQTTFFELQCQWVWSTTCHV